MGDIKKCQHPKMKYGAGTEKEKKGEYIGPTPRVRHYTSEYCPECKYSKKTYGPWLSE